VTRQKAILALRWLTAGLLVSVAVLSLTSAPAAAAPAPSLRAGHQLASAAAASDQRRQRLEAQLAAAVRGLHRDADRAIRDPTSPIERITFTTEKFLMDAMIRAVRKVGGLDRQANAAQLVVDREMQRVQRAWTEVDKKAEIAAVVQQLQSVALDAARASGAKTEAEINAFKKAHLSDIRYAGRRWLVDRAVGRQGAVFLARGARNPRLRNAIEQMYRRTATTGDGGTADKLLEEVRAGCRGPGCEHFIKSIELRRHLLKIRRQVPLSPTEIGITDELVGALTKAIRAAGAT
jgi:hypothetical protein